MWHTTVVRNGEGTQHVLKISVTGAPDDIFARDLGRFVANSNLVKCAISGNDPNVGRIAGAAGSFLGIYYIKFIYNLKFIYNIVCVLVSEWC